MSEDELEPDSFESEDEPEPDSFESEDEPEPDSFEINTIDDLYRVVTMAQGGNPDATQTLNDFLKFSDNIERTNLPKRRDVQMIAYLNYAGEIFYPDLADDPFNKAADCLARAFMAKGGDKSKQFVDLMRNVPAIVDLQTTQESLGQSLRDRIFRRGEE